MAGVLPELAGAGGDRDGHRGSVLVPPESGGCTQGDRFPGRRAAPVPAGHEPGGHVAAGGGGGGARRAGAAAAKDDSVLARTAPRSIPMAASASGSRLPNRPAPAP